MGFFGESGVDPNLMASAKNIASTISDMHTQNQASFGEYTDAMKDLTSNIVPMLESGVVPFGYSPALDQLLTSVVQQTGSQATANAINAATQAFRQESGGAAGPQGAQEAVDAMIQAKGQQETAAGMQKEKIAGFQQGAENLAKAGALDTEAAKTAGSMAETTGSEEGKDIASQADIGQAIFGEQAASSPFSHIMSGLDMASKIASTATSFMGLGGSMMGAGGGAGGAAGAMQDSNAGFMRGANMAPTNLGPAPMSISQ